MSFMSYFFVLLNNIPVYGCTTLYPFIYGRAGWLLSVFGGYEKAAIHIHVQLFV